MRQAGVLAAAGIIALTEMAQRLVEDHANARRLADGLAQLDGLSLDPDIIKTNIVFFQTIEHDLNAAELSRRLDDKGVKILPTAERQLRAVTNYHITLEDIDFTLEVFEHILKQ